MLKLFSAAWCGNCGPLKAALARDGIDYVVVDVDTDPEEAITYGVRGLPTTILTDEVGVELKRVVGNKPNDVKEMLDT